MPGGRRKSRNPQKWEEMSDENQIGLSVPEGLQSQDNSVINKVERNTGTSINSNNRLLPSGCRTNSQVSHIGLSSKEDNRQTRYKFLNKLTEERNMNKEKDETGNGPSANGNEMTVYDVLQSGRPGTFAECNICNIRLKDWESTVSHIQTHRLAFLPVCISQDRNTLMKQNVTCLSCQKQFQNLSVLISHVRLTHDLTKSPYVCPFCGKVFDSTARLQMHIDIQDVTMRCPVCSASCCQEYLLYSHLSECLTTFHPHLESLACHVCSKRIKMNLLADHMIQHSFHSTEAKVTNSSKPAHISKEEQAEGSKEKDLNEEPSMFLCEVCDERYSSFHQFKTHLNKHSESKKFCPLCYLKGFSRADFVVRHLMLRCPRRNPDQFAFGSIITSIGKYHNQHFLEVLKDIQSAYPFHEGLEAWSTVAAVLDFLQSFKSFTKEELRHLPELSSAFPIGEALKNPTDIELLVWLTEFEREMHAAAQDQTKQKDNVQEINSFKALGLPPKDLSEFERTILNENLNYVLKKDKSGRPIELNFESIDGQVTITPHKAVDDTMDMRQDLMDHKPSMEFLKKTYPGISFHPEVDVSTLKRLNDEAMKLVKRNPVDEHIKNGGPVTAEDFLRLDWEAQYLRSKEQFYIKPDEKMHELSPLCKKKRAQASVDEKILLKLREEAKSLMEAVDPKTKKMKGLSEADKERLLNEAKQL